MINKFAALGFMALVVSASAADAQQRGSRPIELGIDGGITVGFEDPDNITVVSIPVQAFRVGFFMTDRVSIEPRFHFNSISGGGASFRTYAVELGALFHPGGYRTGSGVYVRPFGGIEGVGGDLGSDSDGYIGAGLGVKLPFAERRLATRLEGNFAHVFSTGGVNRLGILFGLSYFYR
jgi:hypothetical protein